MIFITTGTQEPFDRLLTAALKCIKGSKERVIIQAKTEMVFPANVEVYEFLNPKEFELYFQSADVIISHAGMGTIILALTSGKPLIIYPRQAVLKEHRNDHQMATARKIVEMNLVYVAFSDLELQNILEVLQGQSNIEPLNGLGAYAARSLIISLDSYIKNI